MKKDGDSPGVFTGLYFDALGFFSGAEWLWLGIYNMPR